MNDKKKASVLASMVADSLALGAHWIYDTGKISKEFGRVDRLLKPMPDSFHAAKDKGEFTHYGDQTLVLLESVAHCGEFDMKDFSNRWQALFSGYKGYVDQATKVTLQNLAQGKKPIEAGSASSDLAGASRISPLVCRYARDPEILLQSARDQTRMTHNHPIVVEGAEFFAAVCWRILRGEAPVAAIRNLAADEYKNSPLFDWVEKGLESRDEESVIVIGRFGQSCHINEAFSSVVHLITRYERNLKEALIQSVMAGGDSSGRGMMVGMVLGAYLGTQDLPAEWISGLKMEKEIRSLIDKIS
ncbi:MAG: ADP-ribosylglycohydrolase family protein [Deltaproteobacteria bacterium]|nr:ADP-ribosylglycohydrolase family protein [Deltaproteobacteria bacterium]